MEYLTRQYDGSDRGYLTLLDLSNAVWPDVPRTPDAARRVGESVNVLRVRSIRIKLETRPAR
jgi:hypothetical protein